MYFQNVLKKIGLNPNIYLNFMNQKAKFYGYNPVYFSDDDKHKLMIFDNLGKKIKFGSSINNDYIINDFNDAKMEVTDNSIQYLFYSDIFKLLRLAYSGIYEKEPTENPLDVLNSSEVLYQFIIFYVV